MLQARRLQPSLLPHTWHCCAMSKVSFDKSTVVLSIGDPALSNVINRTPATYLSTKKQTRIICHTFHHSVLRSVNQTNNRQSSFRHTVIWLTRVIHSPCWNPAYKQSWQEMFSIGNCASVKACKSNEIHVPTQWTSHPVIWSLEPSHDVNAGYKKLWQVEKEALHGTLKSISICAPNPEDRVAPGQRQQEVTAQPWISETYPLTEKDHIWLIKLIEHDHHP